MKENLQQFVKLLKKHNNNLAHKAIKKHLKEWNILNSNVDITKLNLHKKNKEERIKVLNTIINELSQDFMNDSDYNYLVDLRIKESVGSISDLVSMPLKAFTPFGEIKENTHLTDEKIREESFRLKMIDYLIKKDESDSYRIADILKNSYVSVGIGLMGDGIYSDALVTIYVQNKDDIVKLENDYKKNILKAFNDLLPNENLFLGDLVYKVFPEDYFKSLAYDSEGKLQLTIDQLRIKIKVLNENTQREINNALTLLENEQYLSSLRLLLISLEEITDEIIVNTESNDFLRQTIGLRKKIEFLNEKYDYKINKVFFSDIVDVRNSFVHAAINLKDQTSLLIYLAFILEESIKIIDLK